MLRVLAFVVLLLIPSSSLAIVGGRDAVPGEVPSIVALVDLTKGGSAYEAQFCAGTLVAPDRVLTAAHCVFTPTALLQPPSSLGVVAGVQDLTQATSSIAVAGIDVHPGWDPIARSGTDLAVLTLAQPIIDIPTLAVAGLGQAPAWLSGRPALLVGWGGLLSDDGTLKEQEFPTQLRVANSLFVADATCTLLQGAILRFGTICAGSPTSRTDACAGDSGGPLIGTEPTTGTQVLVGVVSGGYGCNQRFHPGVYAMTAPTTDWLRAAGVPVLEGTATPGPAPRAKVTPATIRAGAAGRLRWRMASRAPSSEDVIITTSPVRGIVVAWKRTPMARPSAAREKSITYRPPRAYKNSRLFWCVVPTSATRSGVRSCARLTIAR